MTQSNFVEVTPERIDAMTTLINMGYLNQHAVTVALHENRICRWTIECAIRNSDNPAYFEQRFEFKDA